MSCVTLEWAVTAPCRPTVALRNKDEFHGYTLCVYKAVAGKKGSVGHSWLSLVCRRLHHLSRSHIVCHSWLERVSILRPLRRQCLEMGQLVLSSFLSPLKPGGRKFKSNITGCTSCFRQMGHREGCREKHRGKGQRKKPDKGRRCVACWGEAV